MNDKEQFEDLTDALLVRAPAKINLSLLIAGKRPDGFHEIETIMAKINYYDHLLIQKGQKPGIEVVSEGPCWAPQAKENIIYHACELFFQACDCPTDIKVTLTKNIPAGSGLGSASSDAAATLMGLNRFLKAGISDEKLHQMAADLGSDVAFFLGGPLAICTGKGEKLEKIENIFNFLAILILPDVNVSTKAVYDNYKHDSTLYQKLSALIKSHLDKNKFDLISKMCANMLQESCYDLHPGLADLKTEIETSGLGPLCLSGSGSAVFCILDKSDEETAAEYGNQITGKFGCKSVIVSNNRW